MFLYFLCKTPKNWKKAGKKVTVKIETTFRWILDIRPSLLSVTMLELSLAPQESSKTNGFRLLFAVRALRVFGRSLSRVLGRFNFNMKNGGFLLLLEVSVDDGCHGIPRAAD